MSTRPWTSSAKREELIAFAYRNKWSVLVALGSGTVKPHLDSVLRGYKVVEKSLLQSKELIMREVCVIARDQGLGRRLIACNTGCEARNETRGLLIVEVCQRGQRESGKTNDDSC